MFVCLSSWGYVIDTIYLVPIYWRRLYNFAAVFSVLNLQCHHQTRLIPSILRPIYLYSINCPIRSIIHGKSAWNMYT